MEDVKAALRDDLQRAYDGEPWHGPSLMALLGDIAATEAHAHAVDGAHSIWELVLHMAGWMREGARRLRGAAPALPADGDWPAPPTEADSVAWRNALAALAAAHAELLAALDDSPAERLDALIGTSDGPAITCAGMIRGFAQHHAYHGGQIALLRKAVRRPAGIGEGAPG